MNRRLILALAPAALALAGLAHAQPHGAPHGAPSAEKKARHEAMHKQHLEDLKTVLRLRPDQAPALAAFAEAHKPQRHEFKERREPKALTTPERLERMSKHQAEMAAQQQRRRDALAKFYAALSPEQQAAFDALQRLKGPHGRHGGGSRMIMRRHGGPDGPTPGHEPPR